MVKELVNSGRSEISLTQSFLLLFVAHTAIAFWHHFHPRITQNMDLETVSHFGTANQRQITKMSPKWVPGDSKRHPQMDKNEHLDPNVSIGCPCGHLDHQSGPRVPKMQPQGLQNNDFS